MSFALDTEITKLRWEDYDQERTEFFPFSGRTISKKLNQDSIQGIEESVKKKKKNRKNLEMTVKVKNFFSIF